MQCTEAGFVLCTSLAVVVKRQCLLGVDMLCQLLQVYKPSPQCGVRRSLRNCCSHFSHFCSCFRVTSLLSSVSGVTALSSCSSCSAYSRVGLQPLGRSRDMLSLPGAFPFANLSMVLLSSSFDGKASNSAMAGILCCPGLRVPPCFLWSRVLSNVPSSCSSADLGL